MKYVNERKNSIIITQNGEAKAVLIDIETYQDTEDAFALMSIEIYELLTGRFELYSLIEEGLEQQKQGKAKPMKESMQSLQSLLRRYFLFNT